MAAFIFKSRFKGWIRTVALAVVLIFVPEQASWAFNYNPAVIWQDKFADQAIVESNVSPQEVTSQRIAASVQHLLNQIAGKKNTRIQLQLSNANADSKENPRQLFIDSNTL